MGEFTIMTRGTNTTDFDTYIITSRESIKDNDEYIYTLFDCIKPNNTHPTQFKFNYVDDQLDNVQVITKKDTIARMLTD